MKATDVRILPALDPGDTYLEPNFLVVETTLDEQGEAITSIAHVNADDGQGWGLRSLGQIAATTHSMAREWAVAYAATQEIPLVYERNETA